MDCLESVPVLPSLQSIAIEQIVQRLPIVEDFVTVVNQVQAGTQEPCAEDRKESKSGTG